jgi:hypothetical protein
MYTQSSLQDTKLESCEEQSPSNWDPVLLSEIETLKNLRT